MAYGLPQGGQRLIVADRASRVTGRELVVPGLKADPRVAAAPGPWDKEFWAGQMPQGYTEVNSPTWDYGVSVKGHFTASVAANLSRRGIFWPSPPTPFTVTTYLADLAVYPTTGNNSQQFGLAISDSTPDTTNVAFIQFATLGDGTTNCIFQASCGGTTNSASTAGYGIARPVYFRLVVNSSTSVDCQFSFNGIRYTTLRNGNPGFTVASLGFVWFNGTTVTGAPTKYTVPWIKVTTP